MPYTQYANCESPCSAAPAAPQHRPISPMTPIWFICVAVLMTGCADAARDQLARPVEQASPAIISGTACTNDEPSALAILFTASAKHSLYGTVPMTRNSCAGTLIAPDVVLSAGHCVQVDRAAAAQGITLEGLKLYVSGQPDLTYLDAASPGQAAKLPADAVEATSWISHPNFDVAKLTKQAPPKGLLHLDDIALLFLSRPITHIAPAIVISAGEAKQLKAKAKVRIVGWGRTTATKPPPGAAQASGKRMCATSFINELGQWEMQIGSDAAMPHKCQGDSGGPSYLDVLASGTRKTRVVGITSRAYDPVLDCKMGGVDTRVDAYLGWIDKELRKACAAGKRTWCKLPGLIPASHYDPPAAPDGGQGPAADGGAGQGLGSDEAQSQGGCELVGQAGGPGGTNLLLLLLLIGVAVVLPRVRGR